MAAGDEARVILPGRRELGRYEEVVATLTRHGIGLGVERSGLYRLHPRGLFGNGSTPPTAPGRAREALGELGTTFVKLGQVLSTREDLVPPAYAQELAQLRDHVPAVPASAIRARIEADLGRPLDRVFATFDDEPLASASIGQVHAATLPGGERVVVKVQKPGVEEQIETDLVVLRRLAEHAERRSVAARRYRAMALVEELRWTLQAELDYLREGRNAERFARQFADDPLVRSPRIWWPHTTRRVLTMERVAGTAIDDVDALRAQGIELAAVARRFGGIVLSSILVHGFFHADPHPGNYLVDEDGGVTVVDFGMTGHVTSEMREQLVVLLRGIVDGDREAVLDALAALGVHVAPARREALKRDVAHLLDAYYGLDLGELSVSAMLRDLSAAARSHAIPFPPELALLARTAAMAEGVTARLDPAYNPAEEAEHFARETMRRRFAPQAVAERTADAASEAVTLVTELPAQLRRVMRQVEHGDFEVRLRRDEINMALDGMSAIVNRLAAVVIGSAIAIAIALLLQVYRPPGWEIVAAVGIFGGPVVVGVLWTWAALSTRRRD